MAKLTLVLVTHAKKLLEVECDEVNLPGSEGYLGVLPGHTPLISTLKPGILTYKDGSTTSELVLASGFCEVSSDVVTLLADSAETAEDIDVEAARQSKAEAEAQMVTAAGDELVEVQKALALAEARLSLAG